MIVAEPCEYTKTTEFYTYKSDLCGVIYGHVWMWELDCEEELSAEELMLLNCGVGEDSWESPGLEGDPTSPF